METKVEILARNIIKPASPTPDHLRNYKLSLLDQFMNEHYGGIVFFYASNPEEDHREKSRSLQRSLSETLTHFYPLAGRFKDTSTIDCNDEGGYFIEAKTNCKLSDFLGKSSLEMVSRLNPTVDSVTMELSGGAMLLVQLTTFECRGMAISFCLQHRFCDLSSVVSFIKSWTAIARGLREAAELPEFISSSLFPPKDLPPLPVVSVSMGNRITTKLLFDGSKIAALKSKAYSSSSSVSEISGEVKQSKYLFFSRVEVVVALILKCIISAEKSASKLSNQDPNPKPSVFFQSVNLRKRMVPPLSENSIGNLFWMLPILIENDMEFHELVAKMRSETTAFFDEKVRKLSDGGDEGSLVVLESVNERKEMMEKIGMDNTYCCTSWCRFPLYEMDFGWGNPIWVSNGVLSPINLIVLEDTKCGNGVQAWVSLFPQVMAIFERDEELLEFASINPNAIF